MQLSNYKSSENCDFNIIHYFYMYKSYIRLNVTFIQNLSKENVLIQNIRTQITIQVAINTCF